MTLPIMVAGLSDAILTIIDTLFLAKVGTIEVGAIAYGDSFYSLFIILVASLANGLQILVAQCSGKQAYKKAGELFIHNFYLSLVIGVIGFLLLFFLAPYLVDYLIQSEKINTAVTDFLYIMSFGILLESLFIAIEGFYLGIARMTEIMVATIILAIVNIVLDYCLIFGHFGFPVLGIKGAAIASVIAIGIALLYLLITLYKDQEIRNQYGIHLKQWEPSIINELSDISLPLSLQSMVHALGIFIFFVLVEHYGEFELAVASIIYICLVIFLIPIDGFAETTVTLVGNLIGQEEYDKILKTASKITALAFTVLTPILAISFLFPEWFISLFSSELELVENSSQSLKILIFSTFLLLPGEIYLGVLEGIGDTVATFWIQLVQTSFFLLYIYLVLHIYQLPFESVWISEAIFGVVGFLLAYFWIILERWKAYF